MNTCRECGKEYMYDRSKGHRKTKCGSCNTTAGRVKKKVLLVQSKGGECVACGYNRCARALEFHHRIRETKEFAISEKINRGMSYDQLLIEVQKCELLCSNCHAEFEALLDGVALFESPVAEWLFTLDRL